MSVETAIQFVMNHNAALIEGLIGLILVSVLFLAYRAFQAPDEAGAGHSAGTTSLGDLTQLEETLKKLLDKASGVPSTVGTASDNNGVTQELLNEIELLKGSLIDKQTEIEKMKTAGAGAASAENSGMSDDMRAKLEAQLKELKGKLEEYEIISEDIADLSFYKEENAKLLKQLEAVKGGAPVPAATVPAAPAVAPAAVVSIPSEPAPAPIEAASEPAPATEAAPSMTEPSAVAEVSAGVDDDLMAEFARAVQDQTGSVSETPDATKAESAAKMEDANGSNDSNDSSVDDVADLGSMDLDKIAAEAEGITAQASDSGETQPNALEAGLDTDKLIQEASDLTAVKAEDKKLMNEFENFVKGS